MSYAAQRWAQAQTLVIGRDPNAILALGVLADAYIEKHSRCVIESYKDLAISCGFVRSETASAAVERLSKLGLVKAIRICTNRRLIAGTRFELVGYVESEWPPSRKGRNVWIEVASSRGVERQSWWPSPEEDDQTGYEPDETVTVPCQNGYVPVESGMPYPVKADSVPSQNGYEPAETVARTLSNRAPYPVKAETKNKEGINIEEIDIDENATFVAPKADVRQSLDTNPNTAPIDDVPFPEFEEPTSEELFDAPLVDEAKPRDEPQPKVKPKPRTRKAAAKKAADWPVEDDGVDAETREAYLAVRKAKRVGPLTPKAYEQISEQAKKYGVSVKVALIKCIERGWVFPYDGAFEEGKNYGKAQQSQQKSAFLRPQSEIDYTYGLDRWNRS